MRATGDHTRRSVQLSQQPMMQYYRCFARRRNSLFGKTEIAQAFQPIATVHGVVFAIFVWRRG
jgi:hypothetical protein